MSLLPLAGGKLGSLGGYWGLMTLRKGLAVKVVPVSSKPLLLSGDVGQYRCLYLTVSSSPALGEFTAE